ncbi:hypothetical protein ABKN59_001145 [Abortiporus biennis]
MAQPPPHKHPSQQQSPLTTPVLPTAAPDTQFTPRKEFIKDHRTISTFSLLTLSGSGQVRLYSFPQLIITGLRRLFAQHNLIISVRENASKEFYEFALDGKPWSNPKSIKAEKLIVDVLTVVLHFGYAFLSVIDYGSSSLPLPNASAISLPHPIRAPFAISFSSTTIMRVIGPPLHSTPAVLQAVRGAWPRGVVSEKKVGDATYEFKLKGYKWFQEDTFATDSLHHILGLLSALDRHGFTLLTSLSLINRSRVKDLWIFTGHAGEHHDTPTSSPNNSSVDLKRDIMPLVYPTNTTLPTSIPEKLAPVASRMLPTVPDGTTSHNRSISDTTPITPSPLKSSTFPFAKAAALMRKPSPKNGQPVTYAHDYPIDQSLFPNLTGSGNGTNRKSLDLLPRTPDVFYNTDSRQNGFSPQQEVNPFHNTFHSIAHSSPYPAFISSQRDRRISSSRPNYGPQDSSQGGSAIRPSSFLPPPRTPTTPTPPNPAAQSHLQIQTSYSSPRVQEQSSADSSQHSRKHKHSPKESNSDAAREPTPPLLTPGVFRDSAFSSSTVRQSYEVPISWTGRGPEKTNGHANNKDVDGEPHRPRLDRVSTAPQSLTPRGDKNDVTANLPSPITEKPSQESQLKPNKTEGVLPSMSPQPISSEVEMGRNGEAVSVLPGESGQTSGVEKEHRLKRPGARRRDTLASGWVMINIDSKGKDKGASSHSSGEVLSDGSRPSTRHTRSNSDSRIPTSPSRGKLLPQTGTVPATMSAAAKTIAMIDAVGAKEEAQKSSSRSGLKRFLGRGHGNSASTPEAHATPSPPPPRAGLTKRKPASAAQPKPVDVKEREDSKKDKWTKTDHHRCYMLNIFWLNVIMFMLQRLLTVDIIGHL